MSWRTLAALLAAFASSRLSAAEAPPTPPAAHCLLRASFNGSADAEFAAGSGKAHLLGDVSFTEGIRGKAVLVGAAAAVAFPLAGNLNPGAGTLSFWAKPVGWSGDDGRWHYLVTLTGDDDWILLQTESGNLVFLGGKRRAYSQNGTPIAEWLEGRWRFVTVTWDQGRNRIYLDGRPVSNQGTWPSVPTQLGGEIRIGGQLYDRAPGSIAIQDLQILDASLQEASVLDLYITAVKDIPERLAECEFLLRQETRAPRNVATSAYGAIVLPSSQAESPAFAVEAVCDGDFALGWRSAPGTFPNWIEVRWPQPLILDTLVVNESPLQPTAQYRVDAYRQGQWVSVVPPTLNRRQPGEQITERFAPTETTRVRYVMLAPRGDPKTACSLVTELQACTAEAMPDLSWIGKPTWASQWIWTPADQTNDITRYFRAHLRIEDTATVRRAVLQLGADDTFEVYLNGHRVGSGGIPTERFAVQDLLRRGDNLVAVKCHQFSGFAGLICELGVTFDNDTAVRLCSDRTWKCRRDEVPDWFGDGVDETSWQACQEFGIPPNCPDHVDQPYVDEGIRERFRVRSVSVTPAEARPGDTVELRLQVAVPRPLQHNYGFIARIGERPVSPAADFTVASKPFPAPTPTRQWVPGETYPLSVKVQLPEWSPHGAIPLFLTPVAAAATGCIEGADEGEIGQVTIRRFERAPVPWPAKPPRAEVRHAKGRPALFVNGKLVPPQILTENTNPSYQALGEQARTGIHVWRLYASRGKDSKFYPDDPARERAELCAVFDQYVNCLLKLDPEAYILLGTTFRVSQEWTDTYPDDATLLADGHRVQHSFSSRRWLEGVRGDVAALVKHAMSQPYSGHVVGLHFGIGGGPETYYWGLDANPFGTAREKLLLGDFSPEHIRAFRVWLRQRYADDPAALQAAWHDPGVTFDRATPDLDVLRREDLLAFRDPARSRLPFDYWEFHAEVMAQRVIDIGTAIKEASHDRYLTGFWGLYSNGMNALTSFPGHLQHSAYAGLQRVLESPAIDYVATLQEYLNVRWGTPMVPDNLTESIRRHGKLCLVEYDMRTFFTPLQFTERTFSQPETLSVMGRDITAAAVRGDAFWWVAFPQGNSGRMSVPWFAEDSILDRLASGRRLYAACYRRDLSSVSEIAVFLNNADAYALDVMTGHPLLASAQYNTVANELTKLGAPFDLYQLDDIALPAMAQYRAYVFANAYNLTDAQRRRIMAVVRQKGKTAVWLYAPGFCDGSQLSVARIAELTGIRVGYDAESLWPEVVVEKGHAVTAAWTRDETIRPQPYRHYAGEFKVGPVFYVDDPAAEVLGRYVHNRKAAYAGKLLPDGSQALYMAIPYLTAGVMRGICRSAGVHLYADRDVYLDASRHLLQITSTAEGFAGPISLPRPSTVCDADGRRVLARQAPGFEASVPPLTSALYFFGKDREVTSFLADLKE